MLPKFFTVFTHTFDIAIKVSEIYFWIRLQYEFVLKAIDSTTLITLITEKLDW